MDAIGPTTCGRGEAGFTLIELLGVAILLAMLAAIAIPSFFEQRDKARDAAAKQVLDSAQLAIETFATDHAGRYTTADASALSAIDRSLAGQGLGVIAAANSYDLAVVSASGSSFRLTRAPAGELTRSCSPPGDGGCPGSGAW